MSSHMEPEGRDKEKDNLSPEGQLNENGGLVLMSERNKQTMRNIRLRQLQRDCPHSRDFYNLTMQIRTANQSQKPIQAKELMQKLYPFYRWGDVDEENDRPYCAPLTTEELSVSLGKLKVFNPTAPKNCLDADLCEKLRVGSSVAAVDSNKAKMRNVYKKIEMLYEHLLTYEETEARISLLKYKCDFDEDVRYGSLSQAFEIMMDSELLHNIIKVEKGKMAVSRLLAVMNSSMGTKILALLTPAFASWKMGSDRKFNRVYVSLSFCVSDSKELDFQAFVKSVDEDAVRAMAATELGTSILMVVLDRGQKLYDEADPGGEFKQMWKHFFKMTTFVFEGMDSLIPPVEIFSGFIKRLVGDENFAAINVREYWQELFKFFEENGSITDGC